MYWHVYFVTFGLAIVKFLFTPTIIYGWYSNELELSHWDVFIPMVLGALFGFNLCYWFAEYLMERAKKRRLKAIKSGKVKKKRNFTRLNKSIVKIKMSNSGMLLLSTVGLMLMSIPIGGIVLAKFYRNRHISYILATSMIIMMAFILTFGNKLIFA
ncbi:MAG: hypothetical protein H6600_02595 [Flavobacteriales bacterium]|nr:hypothetical protein [Flavobacteriales bacterium]